VLTARLALEHGLACNTAGGSHHAFAEQGSGFCVFNDVAVAARVLLAEGCIERALVVDLDVHQGDGTAAIFEDDERVFTFSIHCRTNFPLHKRTSDLDLGLDAGVPVAGVIGGGYAPDLEQLARLHAILPRVASELFPAL
jgi:acetoin utilization deacetylase AcuC-like enzyme